MHELLRKQRARKGMKTPHLTNIRKVLKGNRYKRGKTETRGRKMKFTKANVFAMNKARKALTKTNKNEREVRWEDVRKKARVKAGHRTTLLNAFRREKIPVAARRPREKPQRTPQIKAERYAFAKRFVHKNPVYYIKELDMAIDSKHFDVPATERARQYMKSQQVRFHLRTPSGGLQQEFAKPGRKKNRMNTGGRASVCAGISVRNAHHAWECEYCIVMTRYVMHIMRGNVIFSRLLW